METYDIYHDMDPDEQTEAAVDARDFLGSAYLSKEDVTGETVVELVGVQPQSLPGANRRKLVAQLAGFEKQLILNSTNIQVLVKLFGTTHTAHWRGRVTLYVDPHVTYAGRRVGGIRIKPAAPLASAGRNGAAHA